MTPEESKMLAEFVRSEMADGVKPLECDIIEWREPNESERPSVINIAGFGPAVKAAAVYDRSQPIKCPVCGHLGMRWGGWFTCDWTGKHIVELQSGDVYVAAEAPKKS